MNLLKSFVTIGLLGLTSVPGLGSILPHHYQLTPQPTKSSIVDPDFEKWLKEHRPPRSYSEKTSSEKIQINSQVDELTKSYLHLRDLRTNGQLSHYREYAGVILSKIQDWIKDDSARNHDLLPNLIGEVLGAGKQSSELSKILAEKAGGSCPHREDLLRFFSIPKAASQEEALISDRLNELKSIHSIQYRTRILSQFLSHLPQEKRDLFRPILTDIAIDSPSLTASYSWLGGASQNSETNLALQQLVQSRRYLSRGNCAGGEGILLQAIIQDQDKSLMDSMVSAADRLGQCYRAAGGSRQRLAFWKRIQPSFERNYGFQGWAEAQLNIGKFHWNLDEFDVAIDSTNSVVQRGRIVKDQKYLPEALFLLARILENKQDYQSAISAYESFVRDFSTHERVVAALNSLILIQAGAGKWDLVKAPALQLIETQDNLHINDQDQSILGFALFWLGRAYYEKGEIDFASASWHRLATEMYSTYYGAMGHYLMEKLAGGTLDIAPRFVAKFDRDILSATFDERDRARIHRIEELLKLGLKQEAFCEVSELDIAGIDERKLYKALLLFASEQFLEAIKVFNGITRSYRNVMPAGMELVLYPKHYEEEVQAYSQKAGVDPDFVFALIRQESVFNPRAHSSAGAMGLMQLMKGTAALEIKKLADDYLSPEKLSHVREHTFSSKNLFDVKTNLILGTHHLSRLLSLYNQPVLTLSAYNAGPGAVSRWLRRYPTTDLLYFIEKIPYEETRGYVKLILRNYFYYKRWYNSGDEFPHLSDVAEPLISSLPMDVDDVRDPS